jgi:cbb3-type cytochrome c oxidase subunit I
MTQAVSSVAATYQPPVQSLRDNTLIKAHIYVSVAWLLYLIVGAGLIVALKFTYPDFLSTYPELTWGRLRYVHTQTVAYGWFVNLFLAAIYYMVPRLTERPLPSGRIAWFNLFYYNTVVIIGNYQVMTGHNLGIEWMEYPTFVNIMALLGYAALGYNFILSYVRSERANLYVSSWYMGGFVVWGTLNWVMGALVPAYVAPGVAGAVVGGLFIHDLVGLIVTPMATAIIYYFLPLIVRRPIYSHSLSLIGFWSLAFFYPLAGIHHYYYSPIPFWAQVVSQATSLMLLLTVYTVVYNVFMTMRGRWSMVASNIPLRWLLAGVVFYVMVCTQGPLQAMMVEQPLIHFSDWVVGHSHMALLGFATFVAMAFIHYTWPRLVGREMNHTLAEWSFWLAFVGSSWMFIDLWIGGLMEGYYWGYGFSWMASITHLQTVWLQRTLSGLVTLTGFILVFINLVATHLRTERVSATAPQMAAAES